MFLELWDWDVLFTNRPMYQTNVRKEQDTISSSHSSLLFEVTKRFHKEDRWESLDLVKGVEGVDKLVAKRTTLHMFVYGVKQKGTTVIQKFH